MESAFVLQFSFKHPWTKITSSDQEAQPARGIVALSKPPCHTAGHWGSAANTFNWQKLFAQTTSLLTAAFPALQELQHLHLGYIQMSSGYTRVYMQHLIPRASWYSPKPTPFSTKKSLVWK